MFFKYQQPSSRKFREEEGGEPEKEAPALPDEIKQQLEQFDAIKQENERLQAKIAEANKHAKAAERKAAEEARAKAEADGNFEQLFKSSENERQTLAQQLEELSNNIANEKRTTAALKLAGELAEGSNAELLSDYIAKRLKFVDNSIKVVDESGNLTVSSLADLKSEFASNARFASLLKGNKSSGGGAAGGSTNSGAMQTITRAEFNALDPAKQREVAQAAKSGKATITD